MKNVAQKLHAMWSALWIGTLVGVAWSVVSVFGPVASSEIRGYSYKIWPVVLMTGDLVSNQDGVTLIHIAGYKLRECKFIRLTAYAKRDDGYLDDAVVLTRIAGPNDGSTKPMGKWDLGEWSIWPTSRLTKKVLVYVEHDCDGYPVRTNIADVELWP